MSRVTVSIFGEVLVHLRLAPASGGVEVTRMVSDDECVNAVWLHRVRGVRAPSQHRANGLAAWDPRYECKHGY